MPLPRIGIRADDLLKMKGRSKDDAIAMPTPVGKDENGYVVAWHYKDCDVILHRKLGHYRVREVKAIGETA